MTRRVLLLGLLLSLAGCGEEGPHLYFVQGPTAFRGSDSIVYVRGMLWSVIPWPAGSEFCVKASWDRPVPLGGVTNPMAELCSTSAVPVDPEGNEHFNVELASSESIPSGLPPWKLKVTLSSEYHENKGHDAEVVLDVP